MAALMFQVPQETARILHEIQVPGTPEKHEPHITVMYLGKDVPIERISKMLSVIFDVTSTTSPFTVATSKIGTFPPGDDGVPIIARVSSPALHEFRGRLAQAFDDNDLEYDKKFPDYKPHVTLAFDENKDSKVDMEIPEVAWGAHEMVLWGSNRGAGRLVIKFPLSLPEGRTASLEHYVAAEARAAIQVAMWGKKDAFA